MTKKKVGLLYGGKSAEYEVSVQTALSVINALDRSKYEICPIYISKQGEWIHGRKITGEVEDSAKLEFSSSENRAPAALAPQSKWLGKEAGNETSQSAVPDVIFPLLHGPNGEDGTVQGLLELLNMPYVGSGVMASAAAMDKVTMKDVFTAKGFPQADYVGIKKKQWENAPESAYDRVEETIGLPCFVKPANLGSSVGISKCKTRESLEKAFREAFQFDRKIVVEEHIDGREIEVGVLGNDDPKVSVAGEIVPGAEFYDYQAKYEEGDTSLVIPADIPEDAYEEIKAIAVRAFQALDCAGLSRVDFFIRKSDGAVLINEVNTMPGFTPYSMFPLLWKHSGIPYSDLIDRLLELGMERHEEKQNIKYTKN
ncbi:MAG TPA: D-alanine--D-alanine ligase [Bacillales bacterium]|nr:D-alanine--D-alanine ligase [Bacillales bacterium]